MSDLTWKLWAKDALERAVATAAETLGAYLVVAGPVIDALSVNWGHGLSLAAGSAVGSLLKSLAARKVGNPADASLVK